MLFKWNRAPTERDHESPIKRPNLTGIVTGVVLALLLTQGVAYGAKLITGKDIKNGSVLAKDIKNGTLITNDIKNNNLLSKDLKDGTVTSNDLKNGGVASGDIKDGTVGPKDLSQAAKDSGTPAFTGENWSVVDRNVIGAGQAFLRAGPSAVTETGTPLNPPMGIGSLGLSTGSPTDKAAFGNQVEFIGNLVSDLTAVSYSVFTTGENNSAAPNNMPSITFEIDPNVTGVDDNFSSMVFVPDNSLPGVWRNIVASDDAAGPVWGLTGGNLPCDINGARCTWTELQAALDDGGDPARILTVSVTKGSDFAFSGAVDALTINTKVYDFEPTGVTKTTAP